MKILPQNSQGLMRRGIVPGVHVKIELQDILEVKIQRCSVEGYYLEVCRGVEIHILGSRHNQIKNAERKAASVEMTPNTFYYMLGFGTGHLAKRLLQGLPKSSFLLVVEPCPEIFYRLMMEEDFSVLLNDERAHVVLPTNLETMRQPLVLVLETLLPHYDKAVYVDNCDETLHVTPMKEWRSAISRQIRESCRFTVMNIRTSDVSSVYYNQNVLFGIMCLDWAAITRGLSNRPLVIVAMGPSLDLEYETLRQIQSKCHIGCVDNAYRVLRKEGIVPDFVFQVEWSERTAEFYEGLEIPPHTILAFGMGAYGGVVKKWPGQRLAFPTFLTKALIGEFYPEGVPTFGGNNVGMMGVDFATTAKASPVYLVGFDLCAPMACFFHPAALHLNDAYPAMSRFWSLEKMNYAYIRIYNETIEVPGYDGKPVYTPFSFDRGKKELGEIMRDRGRAEHFFSASRYGNPIPGVGYRPLAELSALLDGLPDKEILHPNQCTLNGDKLLEFTDRKLDEVDDYYRALKDVHDHAGDWLRIVDQTSDEDRVNFVGRQFNESFARLHQTNCAWLEQLLISMDRRIQIRHFTRLNQVKNVEDKREKIREMARLFIDDYPVIASYQKFMEEYLKKIQSAGQQYLMEHGT